MIRRLLNRVLDDPRTETTLAGAAMAMAALAVSRITAARADRLDQLQAAIEQTEQHLAGLRDERALLIDDVRQLHAERESLRETKRLLSDQIRALRETKLQEEVDQAAGWLKGLQE